MPRPIHEIARDIRTHWRDKEGKPNVWFGAAPYLDAMRDLSGITDKYGMDDARSIVTYFLANAAHFRGEHARRIKKELKELLK